MEWLRKRKKNKKAIMKKLFRGSISITLCLLLTPFLTLALSLVEYARYQQVMEVTNEIYELTGISVLSDYDSYMHNRFGLLATTQESNFADGAATLLEDNVNILGNQVVVENPVVTGQLSLSNLETLRKQVVDVGELTATTAILAEDFNLQELLDKLQNVQQFTEIMNTVDSLAELTDKMTTVVQKLEEFEAALKNLKTAVENATSAAGTLSTNMANLYRSLMENGITLPAEPTLEQIQVAIDAFCDSYLVDFTNVYATANGLLNNLNSIKTNLENVKTTAEAFVTAVQEAQEAAENISTEHGVDENEDASPTSAATTTVEDVLQKMVEMVEDTVSDITDETIEAAKQVVNDIIDTALDSAGLTEIVGRYQLMLSGEYFQMPLSDTTKADLIDFLKTVQSVCESQSVDGLLSYFESKFVPNIDIDVEYILGEVTGVLGEATTALMEGIGDRLISLLTNLVNIVKGLFNLDLFYDEDLNAYVNMVESSGSPYQDFLDALGRLFTAVDDFKNAMADEGIISKIKGIFSAMGKMFKAIGDLMQAILNISATAVNSIMSLAGSMVRGDVQELYERVIISGYMRHNLPCRTDADEYEAEGNQINLLLNGEGLTGFAYNDIPRPAVFTGQIADISQAQGSRFQGLASTLSNLQAGHGTDTMFKGAELEYIRAGTNSEIANQIICFFDLYFLRLLLDLPSVFLDGEVRTVATAATVASWVVYILYIVAEPFCDVLLLVNDGDATVPLIRTECWLTATGIGGFITKLGSAVLGEELQNELNAYTSAYATGEGGSPGGDDGGLNYKTHMLIMLLIYVTPDDQIRRLQGLIDLEAKEYYAQQGKTFNMNATYTAVEIKADTTFNPFFDLGTFNGGAPLLPSFELKKMVSY